MATSADVCVLVPTLNEAATIGDVVEGFRERGYENVLVVDGRSTDGTPDVAREKGARVVQQSGTGKGQAVREGLRHVDAEYVLLLDGDGTYRPEDADALLEPVVEGDYDQAVGDRFADMADGAMTRLNTAGNRLINWAFRVVHGRNYEDVLSGYRAFRTDAIERLHLGADGFGIETELSVEASKRGLQTTVVPIRYEARPEASETNLRPFRDGGVIMWTLYALARTSNPKFYFGVVSAVFVLAGAALGGYVLYEWVTMRVSHDVLALVAAFSILFGMQLFMFGMLSDLVVSLHREQMRLLEDDD